MRRKAQELILAVWLEVKFSKKQILALYLNRVYFGAGAYGIEAASQRYFNKPAKAADPRRGGAAGRAAEGAVALFAGLRHRPRRRPRHRRAGRDGRCRRHHRRHSATQALLEPVRVSRTLANQHAQYFIDWVDDQVRGLVGEPTEDLVVETTLDLPLQAAAERAVRRILDRDGGKGVQQAALVALDGEGRVRAMSAAPTMPRASSTAPPTPAARPARPSSRSST